MYTQRHSQAAPRGRSGGEAALQGAATSLAKNERASWLKSILALRLASHRNKVDAVSVAASVREVVAKVSTVNRHALAVLETPHIVPHDLLVSERRPPVRLGLGNELLECPATQRLSGGALLRRGWHGLCGTCDNLCKVPGQEGGVGVGGGKRQDLPRGAMKRGLPVTES